jgi:hypothetical protein
LWAGVELKVANAEFFLERMAESLQPPERTQMIKFNSRRKNMRWVLLVAVSLLPFARVAQAQDPEQSWENLRTLRVGERIQVVDQRLKSQNGTFLSVSDDAITFQLEQNEVAIQRVEVLRLSSREHLGRGKKTLIGLGIGAGIGAATGAIVGASVNDSWFGPGAYAGAFLVLGGAAGAGVGAFLPAGHPTIYRAERRQVQSVP